MLCAVLLLSVFAAGGCARFNDTGDARSGNVPNVQSEGRAGHLVIPGGDSAPSAPGVPSDEWCFRYTREYLPRPGVHAYYWWNPSQRFTDRWVFFGKKLVAFDRFHFVFRWKEDGSGSPDCTVLTFKEHISGDSSSTLTNH